MISNISPTPSSEKIHNCRWWKEAVVYQIYPRSFMDSNNDGIGDIPGIITKLDYLKDLDVDIIWLSPVYKSPNDDNGYDISDYQDIMEEFGTMNDFDRMLEEIHSRGMRLIMDLVVNHTSDEHPWFVESRSSLDNPKRDWYIWKSGKDGKEPNNWGSNFSGSAWEFDEQTGEYFLHLFSKKQPDLNWQNPEVRQAVYAMMRWWFEKGIDGFRMDVINQIAKRKDWSDLPKPDGHKGDYVFDGDIYCNQAGVHDYLKEMHRDAFCQYDIMTVGEIHSVTLQTGLPYIDEQEKELNMMFHFDTLGKLKDGLIPYKQRLSEWYQQTHNRAWMTTTLNNHDTRRQVSQFGNDTEYRLQSAKCLALHILTAPGTPYLYQGEELGMTDVAFNAIDDYRDIASLNSYKEWISQGMSVETAFDKVREMSRDNARTPVQWNRCEHAGFTEGTPWIGVNPNYTAINAESQKDDPESVLSFYKSIIQLRRKHDVLVYGDYQEIECGPEDKTYCYSRSDGKKTAVVLCNFSSESTVVSFRDIAVKDATLLLSNYSDTEKAIPDGSVALRPWESRLYYL